MSGYGSIMSDYCILLSENVRGISLGHGIMWLVTLKREESGCANNRLNP